MKTYKFIIAALGAVILTGSCAKEKKEAEPALSHIFTVDAELPGMEQEPETKGYLGSYISATWTEGDKVSVVNLTTGKILGGSLSADKGGTRTIFSGTVNGKISKGDVVALFHPWLETTQEADFSPVVKNVASQDPSSGVPLFTYGTFTADNVSGTVSGLTLNFYYLLSYLKINMAGLPPKSNVSKVVLRNIPSEFTVSINSGKTGFEIGTPQQKAAPGTITVNGPFTTSDAGAMTLAVGVMPSAKADRGILATVDGVGDFLSPLPGAELSSHKYYNTIACGFEKVGIPGISEYGIYNLDSGAAIDIYDEFRSNLIVGLENQTADFTLLNRDKITYWTLAGIPADATEGTEFTADIKSYGIEGFGKPFSAQAKVTMIENDGDQTKLWLKVSPYLFIVRK